MVKYLVEQGADMEAKGEFDRIPLHIACDNGNLNVVKYLVKQGADVKAINIRSHWKNSIKDYFKY